MLISQWNTHRQKINEFCPALPFGKAKSHRLTFASHILMSAIHRFESPQLQDWIQELSTYNHIYIKNFCAGVHGFSWKCHSQALFSHYLHLTYLCFCLELFWKASHAKNIQLYGRSILYHRQHPASSFEASQSAQGAWVWWWGKIHDPEIQAQVLKTAQSLPALTAPRSSHDSQHFLGTGMQFLSSVHLTGKKKKSVVLLLPLSNLS